MPYTLRIDIPAGQAQEHVVEVYSVNGGSIDVNYGVEVYSYNRYGAIFRMQELTVTPDRFYFHCRYLNYTGFTLTLQCHDQDVVVKGTPITDPKWDI
ncbi:hypothetical protein [Robertmurraya korlensis]|uniref:hypothetical protein n=1 Tax=Robertmurraya korlensis TaxID=519977 RepID=UPI0008267270|nr:hypothetical protein [Robertmurraya korlensis]